MANTKVEEAKELREWFWSLFKKHNINFLPNEGDIEHYGKRITSDSPLVIESYKDMPYMIYTDEGVLYIWKNYCGGTSEDIKATYDEMDLNEIVLFKEAEFVSGSIIGEMRKVGLDSTPSFVE